MVDHTDRSTEIAKRVLRLMPNLQQWAVGSLRVNRTEQDPSFRQLALLFLVRDGETSPVALAGRMGVSRAVMTGLLDRLEQRDLVRREPDPRDRRRLRIVLTDSGQEATARLGRTVVEELAGQLHLGSEEDLTAVEAALPVIERSVQALLTGMSEVTTDEPENALAKDATPAPAPKPSNAKGTTSND
ncbi:MAG: MarR family winged helix-turn-helix transcriptional regulator [Thermomicrobiales bacterium]